MFAIIAAVLFALALLLELLKTNLGDVITATTLITAGLLCLALHFTNAGSWRRGGGRGYRGRRPGPG